MNNIIEQIVEKYEPGEFIIIDGFDMAIIGWCQSNEKLIYSVQKCIHILTEYMNEDDAIEHFEFNVRPCCGENTPIFCDDFYY